MIRRYSIIALPLILLLIAGTIVAQVDQPNPNPRTPPLRVLARFLQLTEEQIEETRTLLQNLQADIKTSREDLALVNEQWKEAMSAESPDPVTIGELAIKRRDNRAAIAAAGDAVKEGFLEILTEDQKGKLLGLRRAERLQSILKTTKALNLY